MHTKNIDDLRDILTRLDDVLLKVNARSPEARPECRKAWRLTDKAASLLPKSENTDAVTAERFTEVYPESLYATGYEYGGLFFQKGRNDQIQAFPSRFSDSPICDLDLDVELSVVDLVCEVFAAGQQAIEARLEHAYPSYGNSRH